MSQFVNSFKFLTIISLISIGFCGDLCLWNRYDSDHLYNFLNGVWEEEGTYNDYPYWTKLIDSSLSCNFGGTLYLYVTSFGIQWVSATTLGIYT